MLIKPRQSLTSVPPRVPEALFLSGPIAVVKSAPENAAADERPKEEAELPIREQSKISAFTGDPLEK